MRKKTILLLGTLLFMSWVSIQFYLFVHKPINIRNRSGTLSFHWLISGTAVSSINRASNNNNNNNNNNDGFDGDFAQIPQHLNHEKFEHHQNEQQQQNEQQIPTPALPKSSDLSSSSNEDSNNNNGSKNHVNKDNDNSENTRQNSTKLNGNNRNNNNNENNNNNNDDDKNQLDLQKISKQIELLESDLNMQTKSNNLLISLLKTIQIYAKNKNKTVNDILLNEKDFLKKVLLLKKQNSDLLKLQNQKPVICVLLFACNRVTVKRNLDQLFKYRIDSEIFPIVVSQDCNHEPTKQIIQSYGDKLKFIQQPDQSDIILKGKNQKKFKGYYKISRHYGWALNQTFNILNYDTVIIVEDDLDIAPDFFEYFLALYPILRSDPSLYCISAWNDNGKNGLVENDSTKLFRSDFFPGLGWMLTKDLWMEFQNKWPKAFWDDWIRQPEQRKNRACIRPELSRTKTFGKKGVSNGLFYEKHLKFIKLNEKFVPFTKMNLSYLLKENYDVEFLKQVYNSRLVSLYDAKNIQPIDEKEKEKSRKNSEKQENLTIPVSSSLSSSSTTISPLSSKYSIRIQYDTKEQFKKAAKIFGLMDDFKSGVPRTGYQGTVGFMYRGYRVYLAPSPIWNGYNVTWK